MHRLARLLKFDHEIVQEKTWKKKKIYLNDLLLNLTVLQKSTKIRKRKYVNNPIEKYVTDLICLFAFSTTVAVTVLKKFLFSDTTAMLNGH